MAIHTIEAEHWVPRPLEEVFEFFSSAHNLEVITPPFLGFRVITSDPIEMAPGTLIDYKLKLHGIPIRWRTKIETWEPPERFTDVQLKGPYKLWHHTHTFKAVDGGTRFTDLVRYELPFGPLGELMHALKVRRDVQEIFQYRKAVIDQKFGGRDSSRAKF